MYDRLLPTEGKLRPHPEEKLRAVLVQARDALIEWATQSEEETNGSIFQDIDQLHEYFVFIDDRKDIQYLQQHLRKEYADRFEEAAPLATTREGFLVVVRAMEEEQNEVLHDNTLAQVVTGEIERGFLDDASSHAALIKSSLSRCRSFGEVARSAHEIGKDGLAERAVDAAITAGLQEDSAGYPIFHSPFGKLDDLAQSFLTGGYTDGVRRVLHSSEQTLPTSRWATASDWGSLAGRAIALGDFGMAHKAIDHVDLEEGRVDLEDKFKIARASNMPVAQAFNLAKSLSGPESRVESFCQIAQRQAAAGDKRGAASTFQLARDAAEEIGLYKVSSLNDIAWAQIDAGDKEGAKETVNRALKVNGEIQPQSDQAEGAAALVDTLAFLGEFERAHDVAFKISDRSHRAYALGHSAFQETKIWHNQETITWVNQLQDPEERCESLVRIADAMVEELKAQSRK